MRRQPDRALQQCSRVALSCAYPHEGSAQGASNSLRSCAPGLVGSERPIKGAEDDQAQTVQSSDRLVLAIYPLQLTSIQPLSRIGPLQLTPKQPDYVSSCRLSNEVICPVPQCRIEDLSEPCRAALCARGQPQRHDGNDIQVEAKLSGPSRSLRQEPLPRSGLPDHATRGQDPLRSLLEDRISATHQLKRDHESHRFRENRVPSPSPELNVSEGRV